jgi:hypothetical protein
MANAAQQQTPDRDLPRAMATQLARTGDSLGVEGLRIVGEGEMETRVKPPVVSEAAKANFEALAVKPEDMARAAAAREAGRPFEGSYLGAGFLFASAGKPERQEQQRQELKTATPAELQAVLARNVQRTQAHAEKEVELRFAQYLRNKPAVAAEIADPSGAGTVEERRAQARKSFGHKNYDEQRNLSSVNGVVVTLPDSEGRILMSLRRGYKEIANELEGRGITPAMTLTGRSTDVSGSKRKARSAEANAAGAPAPANKPRRMVRDGMEL